MNDLEIKWSDKNCITIVLCAKGYPQKYIKNSEIKNLHKIISDKDNQVFHAGTFKKDKKIFSSGGRVLNITSVGKNLYAAREKTLNKLNEINWKDGFFRKDIGWRVI